MKHLEAIQFREWGVWHAVCPDDEYRTLCGRRTLTAKRMWENWSEKHDRCRKCAGIDTVRGTS